MLSKSMRVVFSAMLSVSVLALVGCGIKLGEKNEQTAKVAEIKGTSCLKPSLNQMKLFMAGDASNEDITQALECLQNVLITFKDNIRGKDVDSYTPEEIGNFLTRNFLKDSDFVLTPELMNEIVKFKAMLLGGDTAVITKSEIETLSSLFARYKPELIKLNPHMKVINGKWVPGADREENIAKFQAAKTALNAFLERFGRDLAYCERSYQLNDLFNLAGQIAVIAKAPPNTLAMIENARAVLLKFKEVLIGGGPALQGTEWISFTHTLGEVYGQVLRIKYFLKPLKADRSQEAEKWRVFEQVALDATSLIDRLMAAKGSDLLQNAEIAELLATLKPFMPDMEVNRALIDQIAQLKIMLLGRHPQAAEAWSRADFANLNRKIPALFRNLSIILQNIPHLKADKEAARRGTLKYEDFAAAETQVTNAVKEIANLVVESYDLDVFKATVLNLSQTVLKDKLKLPANMPQLFEVVKAAKYTLTGEPGTGMSRQNIRLLLNVGVSAYGNYVEYANFVSVHKLEENEFTASFAKLLVKFKGTLKLELDLKADHNISTAEIAPLVMSLQENGLIGTKLKRESVDSALNALWTNILNPPENRLGVTRPGQRVNLAGFGIKALGQLEQELQVWVLNQMVIGQIYAQKAEFSKAELLPRLAAMQLTELHRTLEAKGEMNFNDQGFLKILTEGNGHYRKADLIKSNLSRAIARILVRSFASDMERVTAVSRITQPEAQAAFDMVRGVIVDIGMIDEAGAAGFIASRFREANLFLSVGNGDSFATLEELHHLVLHIMSGTARANVLKPVAVERCLRNANQEKPAWSELDEECLINLYYQETAAFADLPQLFALKAAHTEEEVKNYYLSLLKAAGYVQNENKLVRVCDAALFPHVAQYIEMLYFSHDTNRDALLQKDEALAAFPVFRELITNLTKAFPALVEADMPGVFIYLLKEGKAPKTLAEKLKFAGFVKDHDCSKPEGCHKGWDIQSTRLDLGKIFNFIAEATKPKPPEAPAAAPAPLAAGGN